MNSSLCAPSLRTSPSPRLLLGLGLGAVLLSGACNDSSSPQPQQSGTILSDPAGTLNGLGEPYQFIGETNYGGEKAELRIDSVRWGRMVDVYTLLADGSEVLMQEDFVIDPGIVTGESTYRLSTSPVTGRTNLLIRRDATESLDAEGVNGFFTALIEAGQGLIPVFDNGATGAGFYTMVPRNATVVLVFDDLLDASTVNNSTIRSFVGVPSIVPFEMRVVPDRNYGDLVTSGEGGESSFHTTRVLLDTTISTAESFETNPPTPVNLVGLPGSVDLNSSNFQVRIPSELDTSIGQDELLRNVSGSRITVFDNGTFDGSTSTQDVVRAMRAGGKDTVTGDPYNGFLQDTTPPQVLGILGAAIGGVPFRPGADPASFRIPLLVFDSAFCAQTPVPGDVLEQTGLFLEVTGNPAPVSSGNVYDVDVQVLSYPPEWDDLAPEDPLSVWPSLALGQVQFLSVFDPAKDVDQAVCFLQITPTAGGYPTQPDSQLQTTATFGIRFTEPIDPVSMTAFDSLLLTRTAEPTTSSEYVIGTITQSLDLQSFTLVPSLLLAHVTGQSEQYFIELITGNLGPSDLAGNSLLEAPEQASVTIEPFANDVINGGRVTRFTSPDEEAPFSVDEDEFPEWFGQHTYDITNQLIRPRPVVRFDAVVDTTHPITNLFTPYASDFNINPLQPTILEPLHKQGCRLQTLWRFYDVGWDFADTTNFNVDVEGLAWAPLGGDVISDVFQEFQISLSHSGFLPDEMWNPPPIDAAALPNTGLGQSFAANILDFNEDPQTVVHGKARGYVIQPGDRYTSESGVVLMPYPLNRGIPAGDYEYYTWRDTSIRARGAPNGCGVDTVQALNLAGFPLCPINICYPPGMPPQTCPPHFAGPLDVPSVGMPLLMDFKVWPDDQAIGLNRFDVALAGQLDPWPAFRAFSSGGENASQVTVLVDPDLQDQANGGFNPNSEPFGATTPGLDTRVYLGAMNLVVRVSRSYSVWFPVVGPTGGALTNPGFLPPVIEPKAEDQVLGTEVQVAFRGAANVGGDPNNDWRVNASTLDLYGDYYEPGSNPLFGSALANTSIGFLDNDDSWFDDISDIDNSQFYQVRLTFISNAESGLSPEVSALGVLWEQ